MPDALFDLAVCLETGEGVDKNLKDCFNYYLQAAIRGDQQSVFEVGRCYFEGIGVSKDIEMSNIWFERAKELGVYEYEE